MEYFHDGTDGNEFEDTHLNLLSELLLCLALHIGHLSMIYHEICSFSMFLKSSCLVIAECLLVFLQEFHLKWYVCEGQAWS